MTDAEQHLQAYLDRVPALPSDMNAGTAAMWAAITLQRAALDRGWSRDEVRKALVLLVAGTLAAAGDDEQIIAELRDALAQARATTQ